MKLERAEEVDEELGRVLCGVANATPEALGEERPLRIEAGVLTLQSLELGDDVRWRRLGCPIRD